MHHWMATVDPKDDLKKRSRLLTSNQLKNKILNQTKTKIKEIMNPKSDTP
jgi:hypothetical protein